MSSSRQDMQQGSAGGRLTNRQHEVIALLAQGLTHKQIARKLHIAVGTVDVHLRDTYRRLDVSCAVMAVAEACKRGLLP